MPPLSPFLLWAQVSRMPGVADWLVPTFRWLQVFGEPTITAEYFEAFGYKVHVGGLITWSKVVGLFALLSWLLAWVVAAYKTRTRAKTDWFDVAGLVALIGLFGSVLLHVLETTGRLTPRTVNLHLAEFTRVPGPVAIGVGCLAVLLLWVEGSLWGSIRRIGKVADVVTLVGVHLAVALGFTVAYYFVLERTPPSAANQSLRAPIVPVIQFGVRFGVTYMGLVVLAKMVLQLLPEVLALRSRRLFAIARLAIIESTRKMWAPYVVVVMFAVILAFAHWFLPTAQQRPAELGRIYVGMLTLLTMLLLTVMVTVLAPISMPQDIQAQTIYTVVTKPVRRLEVIWGRMIGYMTIVTALVLLAGLGSVGYLYRVIWTEVASIEKQAGAIKDTDPDRARFLRDQADQLRTRMSARMPLKGSLTFTDSRGTPHRVGIDVGQEGRDNGFEVRSHIEGGTPASAIWRYGVVPDPYDARVRLDRRVDVATFLKPGTMEALADEAKVNEFGVQVLEARRREPNLPPAEAARIAAQISETKARVQQLQAESKKKVDEFNKLILAAKAVEAKDPAKATELRTQAARMQSPDIPMEMTFTIYRTTKGRVGDPVYAEIEVENANRRAEMPKHRDAFPIREYYTTRRYLPAAFLVGSLGQLTVSVRCMSPTQYLGMAESDFHLLAYSGNFEANFFKGLFGIWLQAMVLTAIGVFAGTFLSWPVALLFTVAFFVAGHAAQAVLRDFYLRTILGGGPFESLIRLLAHDNQVTELAPDLGVIVARTLDFILKPVLERMVYLIPNLGMLDVSNTVAEGFAVTGAALWQNGLVALAYAVPFSVAGYFILKNREVAA